jgi:hypothetical protein
MNFSEYADILEKIDEAQALVDKYLEQTKKLEAMKKSGEARLRKFPLWVRVLKFYKFSKIKKIIKRRELARSYLTVLTLSMNRQLSRLRRKYNVRRSYS